MADIILKNKEVEIGINFHGAELKSLKKRSTDTEYLWCADPIYWGRTSPVLFPFVGGVKNSVYRHEGKEYRMGQHGFARDKDFELISQTEDTVWFGLDESEDTLSIYPFPFHLEIGYRLEEDGVTVMWKVKNTGEKEMYFAIGAHPAFNCPICEGTEQTDYGIRFQDGNGKDVSDFSNTVFGQGGTVTTEQEIIGLEQGVLPVTENLFDNDALVIEGEQVQRIALLNPDMEEYLAVEFDSPLVGVWSPPKKRAPFICIEPWYGRCDSEVFDGELKERDWENMLAAGEEFHAEYKIKI